MPVEVVLPPTAPDLQTATSGPEPTAGHLLAALEAAGLGPAEALAVDHQRFGPDHPLDRVALRHGRLVDLVVGVGDEPTPTVELRVVGGPAGGERGLLAPGAHVLGRAHPVVASLAHPSVSRRHAALTVDRDGTVVVHDLGSRNGTSIDGRWATTPSPVGAGQELRLGAVRLCVEPLAAPLRAPRLAVSADGRVTVHRPPPEPPSAGPAPVPLPSPHLEPAPPSPFSWATTVVPAVGGVVLAAVLQPVFAMLALLGPMAAGAAWYEGRRRHRRARTRRRAAIDDDLSRLERAVRHAATEERDRRLVAHPHAAVLVERAVGPSPRIWERRAHDPSALVLRVGTGTVAWEPATEPALRGDRPELRATVDEAAHLHDAPLTVDLAAGPLGVVGDPTSAAALVRAVVLQAATLCGPCDLRVAIDPGAAAALDLPALALLPHDQAGAPRTLTVAAPGPSGPTDPATVLAGPAVVLASTRLDLPAWCQTVLEVDALGTVRAGLASTGPTDRPPTWTSGAADGLSVAAATRACGALAGLDDPEAEAGGVPDGVTLGQVVGRDARDLVDAWRRARPTATLPAVLGQGARGPAAIDLVADGPHALVAGTTGAGKSELLRTLVATAAAATSPEHLAFVLIDYKGGTAFDRCADLVHVTGVVTDLDEHLAARAVRCLEAELADRERRLRAVGAHDLVAFHDAGGDGRPLPRLVLVVDEVAALLAELPGLVDGLVDLAQRGRALGIHLVLATQRPAGVVSDRIRANTNLRLVLRTVDGAESSDVLGDARAADLPRRPPGRAWVRAGSDQPRLVQVAHATGCTPEPPAVSGRLQARQACYPAASSGRGGGPGPATDRPAPEAAGPPDDLARLVTSVAGAASRLGIAPPRRPWTDPLPTHLGAAPPLPPGASGGAVPLALADDPDRQRRQTWCWEPDGGHLLVLGRTGSGVTTTLLAAAAGLVHGRTADDVHLYAIGDDPALQPLLRLPHGGAIVAPADRERLVRLVDRLEAHTSGGPDGADAGAGAGQHLVVLLVDGWGALARALDDLDGMRLLDRLVHVLADGARRGAVAVIGADRAGPPAPVLGACAARVVLRLGDRHETTLAVPDLPPGAGTLLARAGPGRGIALPDGLEVQVARAQIPPSPRGSATRSAARRRAPDALAPLPRRLTPADLPPPTRDGDHLVLPVGRHDDLRVARFALEPGARVLVVGPAGSGRSTLLALIAHQARRAGVVVVGACEHDDLPVPEATGADDLVLVDAHDRRALAFDAARLGPRARLVVAVRADLVRRHRGDPLLAAVRGTRDGLVLGADADLVLDALGVAAGPTAAPPAPGRGWLVHDGRARHLQGAQLPEGGP